MPRKLRRKKHNFLFMHDSSRYNVITLINLPEKGIQIGILAVKNIYGTAFTINITNIFTDFYEIFPNFF